MIAPPRDAAATARRCALASTAALALLALASAAPVEAHFILVSPEASRTQDAVGNPQKLGPCGDEAYRGAMDTGSVTRFRAGETIAITIDETIYHPGHYRVALAERPSELPEVPAVTVGSTPCGSAAIQSPAVFPVLVDGALPHTRPFSGQQTIEVTLPSDLTCTRCTLQVIQFMSNHGLNDPGGCFYHHCATIAIDSGSARSSGDAGRDADAGRATSDASTARPSADAGSTHEDDATHDEDAADEERAASSAPPAEQASGCAAREHGTDPASAISLTVLGAAAALLRRRRTRATRRRT